MRRKNRPPNSLNLGEGSSGAKKFGTMKNVFVFKFENKKTKLALMFRSILNQVVYLKAECFHWSKLRKESASDFLLRFLDTEIKLLWPKGWMTAKILFKESHEGHSFVT